MPKVRIIAMSAKCHVVTPTATFLGYGILIHVQFESVEPRTNGHCEKWWSRGFENVKRKAIDRRVGLQKDRDF